MGKKHELMMISEPEAAAVYALKMTPPKGLSVGSNFVVCDAGGGTVDLIAYKVTSLYPLLLEESAVGTGGLCGSAFIDFRFEEYVKERLGFKQFNEMKRKKPKTWTMGLRYFEEFVKRTFNEDETGDINIPMPGLPDDEAAGVDSGFLVMDAAQVKKIFEPVINQVIELVQGQVDAVTAKHGTVTGIILVGGFGQSNHLYTKLKQHFNTAPPPPYTQRPTHETWTNRALRSCSHYMHGLLWSEAQLCAEWKAVSLRSAEADLPTVPATQPSSTRRNIPHPTGIGVRSGKDGWSAIACSGTLQR
jgi:molecular chaperone DnaK (HSP70)